MIKLWIVITTNGIVLIREETEHAARESALLSFEYPEEIRVLQAYDADQVSSGFII